MRTCAPLLVLALAAISSAETVFYGGDADFFDGLPASNSPSGSTSLVADDFTLGSTTQLAGIFGNFYTFDGNERSLYYEIRQGVSSGNGGTLLYSGEVAASVTDLGDTPLGLELFRISGEVSGVTLGPGTYTLGVAVLTKDFIESYLATTSGANGIGGPLANGNSFIYDRGGSDSSFVGTDEIYGFPVDLSLGVNAQPVPEPGTAVAMGLGGLAILRRRLRR